MLPAHTLTLLTLERYRTAITIIRELLVEVDLDDPQARRVALAYLWEVIEGVLGPQQIRAANDREER